MYFDKTFRINFSQQSILGRRQVIDDLMLLVNNKTNHLALSNFLERVDSTYSLDKVKFKNYLEDLYAIRLVSVFDRHTFRDELEHDFKGKYFTSNVSDTDLKQYYYQIKNNFWNTLDTAERKFFDDVSSFNAFVDKDPKSHREKFMIENFSDFKIFNQREWIKYFEKLMQYFFPNYSYDSKISNQNKRRYVHLDIEKKSYASTLFFDKGFFVSELKRGYLEFPNISMELININIDKHYDVDKYAVYNSDIPIVTLWGPNFFIGSCIGRIGSYEDKEEMLKKEFFLRFKVYANFLNVFLKHIECITDNLVDKKGEI
ncbi:MAG: hypothetical protein ABXS91_05130 [Sulfurimonas sp.]